MNPPDPKPRDGKPLDESRPFPAESEWLDLPLPEAAPASPEPAGAATARRDGQRSPADDFVARTLQALAEERELDRQLQRLDAELPNPLLQQFTAPPPSRQFADRTLQALDDARRQHWQRLLARHVAPEPSPQFVARTLQALADAPDAPAGSRTRPAAASARPHAGRARTRLPLLLAAAAVAALGWFAWSRQSLPPLEVRFDARGSAAFAYRHGGSPLAAVLAEAAAAAEPWALPAAAADGLWLALAEDR